MDHVFDLAIIGGGINGCGCAADAVARGLSVVLCEQDDLASQTSSNSSKLIHGGLRYLEYFDFKLVKKALDEQQTLLQIAPHLVHPQRFILPFRKKTRPLWLLKTGLFIYDHLSRINALPNSQLIRRKTTLDYFQPLQEQFNKGFSFYDCTTDDARLTIANAIQAAEHGASILTKTRLVKAEIRHHGWQLTLQSTTQGLFQINAKAVINATGPWVSAVSELLQIPLQHHMSLVKGSHIVVPKLYEGEHAYMLQHEDKRIVFIIPYHGYTMIGTTDVDYQGALDAVHIDQQEISYLCDLSNYYFKKQITPNDIVYNWSGIRPLLSAIGKKASALSRDYCVRFTQQPAPSLTIYGGKITTYRQLAQQALDALAPVFPNLPPSNTQNMPLPGAIFQNKPLPEYFEYAHQCYHWLDKPLLTHYLENYGTRTDCILANCTKMADLGIRFSAMLYQCEVDYLVHQEWAVTNADILWRRTKLGFNMDADEQTHLSGYLKELQLNTVKKTAQILSI